VNVPYTKKAADSVREKAHKSVLTAVRTNYGKQKNNVLPKPSDIGYIAGAGYATNKNFPTSSIIVEAGQSLQKALDDAGANGRWVIAKAGIHILSATLKIPSGVTLSGEGLKTILFLDPASGHRETVINAEDNLHDVTIRDLVIECALKTEPPSDPNSSRSYRGGYNRGGILFRANKEGGMKNITLTNLTVQNATYNGVSITGASTVTITRCDFNENGAMVAPGQRLLHNLLLAHCTDVSIKDSRLDTSPFGSGIFLDHNINVAVTNCEIARNGYHGVLISESRNISINKNLIEANDHSGIMVEFLFRGSDNVLITNNIIHFNNDYGVETYAVRNNKVMKNIYSGNGKNTTQQKISSEKFIAMGQ
jgi:parallel beta-helix repeat protein